MQIIDLFSGVGGFSIAGHQLGWETILFCEKEPFPQQVLRERFPGVPIFDDVCKLTGETINGLIQSDRPVILTGGFPCQPFSVAGAREGTEDSRHLWPEMFRIIKAVRPDYIIGENVPGLLSIEGGMVFEQVCLDLESEGYEVQAFVLPACATGAPHRRDRVWIVASNPESGRRGGLRNESEKTGARESNQLPGSELAVSPAPDTNEIGINRCSQTGSNEGQQSTDSEQSGHGWTSETGGYVGERIITDTNEVRLQQCENRGEMGGGQAEICGTGGKSSNAIEANGNAWPTPNTQQERCGGRGNTNGITEEWEVCENFGHDRNGIQSETEGCGEFIESGVNGNSKHDGPLAEQELRGNEESSDQWREKEQNASKQPSRTDRPNDATGIHGSEIRGEQHFTQNPWSSGCEHGINDEQGSIGNFGESGTGGNERNAFKADGRNYWHDWPSLSPFHSGHDGLSTELVRHIRTNLAEAGETPENIEAYIRKEANWLRKQAIMAAGNAVVPTVVLQVMKAIQNHYENTND
jgi:DNA (cytosine-5)-methyltransferase 1